MEAGFPDTSVRGFSISEALKKLTSRDVTKDEFEKILNLISDESLREDLRELVLINEISSDFSLCILLEYCEVDTMNHREETIAHVILGLSNDDELIAKLERVISGLREEFNLRENT